MLLDAMGMAAEVAMENATERQKARPDPLVSDPLVSGWMGFMGSW
jgi:hypothetical protein